MDPLFPNTELEWSTKRRGVSILVGLLVKVEGTLKEADIRMLKAVAQREPKIPQGTLY